MKSLISFRHPVVIKRDHAGTEAYGVVVAVEGQWQGDGGEPIPAYPRGDEWGEFLEGFIVEKVAFGYQASSGLFAMISLAKPVIIYLDPSVVECEQLVE